MNRLVRPTTFAVAGLAAAIVISGCSSGDGGSTATDRSTAADSPAESPATGGDSSGGTSGAKAAAAVGSWLATTDGKSTVMVIQGQKAVLMGATVCSGTIDDAAKLTLRCPDGDNDRTTGSVESADSKTLKVSWSSGIKDNFKKTDSDKPPVDPAGS